MIDPGVSGPIPAAGCPELAHGARMNLDNVRLIRNDGSEVTVDMLLGTLFWDKGPRYRLL